MACRPSPSVVQSENPKSTIFVLSLSVMKTVDGPRLACARPSLCPSADALGQLNAALEHARRVQRHARHVLAQRAPRHVFVRQVHAAVLFADVEQRGDVRVREGARLRGVREQRLAPARVAGDVRRHDSQRDRPPAPRVARAQQFAQGAPSPSRSRILYRPSLSMQTVPVDARPGASRARVSAPGGRSDRVRGVSAPAWRAGSRCGSAGCAGRVRAGRPRPGPRRRARASTRCPRPGGCRRTRCGPSPA